ncbi:nitrous oxide-stimulated promoter family protein [Halosquirtibacter laminarini]|uniref:Nitrous oxide-stimulated promoter family protein n=1 Tax=Halosquirtibacter laminarini TaxID=3374600 RepID=A0AC61NGL8_9BACT|nr:nitrous oxide-stimulated promoter family protein [Prolixibacteraceae bacterium]
MKENCINQRDKEMMAKMIQIYCKHHHQPREKGKCDECESLKDYAMKRLENCPFGEEKPICKRCTIHCYSKDRREEIKKVMRFSGPRMLFYEPLFLVEHILRVFR